MTASGSTRVERFEDADGGWYLKTYRYEGLRAALRGAFRNTFLAPSRVARELRALQTLTAAGVQPDLEPEIQEERRAGWLRCAQILTRDFGGADLEARLSKNSGSGGLAPTTWKAIGAFVTAIHETGLCDPDLKARNILVREMGDDGFEFAKIDASSSRVVRFDARRHAARCAHEDRILLEDLERCGADAPSLDALREGLAYT